MQISQKGAEYLLDAEFHLEIPGLYIGTKQKLTAALAEHMLRGTYVWSICLMPEDRGLTHVEDHR